MDNQNSLGTTLLDLDEQGKPYKSRISDPLQAQEIANRFIRDDMTRAGRRLKVQQAFNGNAPKSRADMEKAGRAGDSNLNWREHKGHIINAWNPYFDLRSEVPVCIDGDLNFTGDSALDQELMRGFAQYFHELLFNSPGFDDNTQLCDLQMLLHGIGCKVWEDEWNWQPRTILSCNIYVPDETNGSLDNCEMLMLTNTWTVAQLWDKIKNPERAKAMKWNVEAVKRVIMESGNADSQMIGVKWDRWEQALKNGDIYVSQTQTKRIQLCTIFVKELNDEGTISQKIVPYRPGGGPTEFLYDSDNKYKDWSEVICAFPYDIGADGTWHSIKGLGTEIYAFCAYLNNVKNSIADLVTSGIKPMWQTPTNAKVEEYKMARFGGGNLVPSGLVPLQLDMAKGIMPAIEANREFNNTLTRNTGAYNQGDVAPPTVEETAKAAMIRASERAKMTKGSFNRYYRSVDREYKETWRRAVNPNLRAWHPGAREALEFQNRCYNLCDRLGVPHEALQKVTNIRANRSLGFGSPAMRIEIATQFKEMALQGLLDEPGKNNALRAYVAALTSYSNVDAYVAPLNSKRENTNDQAVAAQEDNGFNALGMDAEAFVVPGQNHVLHLMVHVPSMQKDAELCQNGQQEPAVCSQRLEAKGAHAAEHLAAIEGNPTRQSEYRQFKQALQELASFKSDLDTMLEQQAKDAPPPPEEVTPEMAKVQGNLAIKEQKEQATMALRAQKQQFDQQLKAQNAEFERRLKDLETASELNRRTTEHRMETGMMMNEKRLEQKNENE